MNKIRLSQQIINKIGICLLGIGLITLGVNYYLIHEDLEEQFNKRAQSLTQTLVFSTEGLLDIQDRFIVERIIQNYATLPEVIEVTIINPDATILATAPYKTGELPYIISEQELNRTIYNISRTGLETNFITRINNREVIVNIFPFSSSLFNSFQGRGLAIIILDLDKMHQEINQIFIKSSMPLMSGTIIILIFIGFLIKINIINPLEEFNKAIIKSKKTDIFNLPKHLPNQEIYFLAHTFQKVFQERIESELLLKASEKREKNKSQELEKIIAKFKITKNQLSAMGKIAQLHQALLESESRYRAVIKQTSEGIVLINAKNKEILEVNQAFCNLLAYQEKELIGLTIYQLSELNKEKIDNVLDTLIQKKDESYLEFIWQKKEQEFIETEVNVSIINYSNQDILCLSVRDITERKITEKLLNYQALYDSLTNIPNRSFLHQKIDDLLDKNQEKEQLFAILFMDLDRFKIINDTLGHNVGDQLLQKCAQRIENCLKKDEIIARWGGDEFIILIPDFDNLQTITQIVENILEIIKAPFYIDNHIFYISSSIGISLYPQDGKNKDILIKNADVALYKAKDKGRNNYQFYHPQMNEQSSELLLLESYLHKALEKEELLVYYQPQIDLNTCKVCGLEALIRWKHPKLGLISPAKFIPLAEETGLIISIGEWVLKTACEQNKKWQEMGLPPVKISVNISPLQFQQGNLMTIIENILTKTNLNPHYLELEITETTLMQNINLSLEILNKIIKTGVKISMDDFGTGYSSLSYLKEFPINTLKIDQSFIRDLQPHSQDLGIIEAIMALSRSFKLNIIAEGVEKEYQLNILKNLQCHIIQGYLFSKPLTTEDATNFMINQNKCNIPYFLINN